MSCYIVTYTAHAFVDCHPYIFPIHSLNRPLPQYTQMKNSPHSQAGPHICHRRPNPAPFQIEHPYTSPQRHHLPHSHPHPNCVFRGWEGSRGSNNTPPQEKNNYNNFFFSKQKKIVDRLGLLRYDPGQGGVHNILYID